MRLTNKSPVELRQIIASDPAWRAAAWRELRSRNQFRQQIERENGVHPTTPRAPVWTPPNLEPKREGPMV